MYQYSIVFEMEENLIILKNYISQAGGRFNLNRLNPFRHGENFIPANNIPAI
jgi:hypothetical protein